MGRTVENVDEATLEEAQRLLGTSSGKDTVNAALREVVRRRLVDEYLESMSRRDARELEGLRAEAWQ
ncbi:type II toxin-antitoxin system VapB family antitoxin [Nonomuraea endophytica]|uniref:type II toxin-antitoxin system VapB family antitoxin n=1 Tax=Nonomuraea endophytica TaxID=714136 RepID=UPI0037CB100A